MVRTPDAAVAWAKVPRKGFAGLCYKHTRMAYDVPLKAGFGSARDGWNKAKYKHPGAGLKGIVKGAWVFLDRPSSKYGHSVMWLGDGTRVASTDNTKTLTQIYTIAQLKSFGYTVVGWAEDINGVRVVKAGGSSPKPPTPPAGGLLRVGSTGSRVRVLQQELKRKFPLYAGKLKVDGVFGKATLAAVKEFQRRVGLVADGVVGPKTLAKLAVYGIKV